MAKNTEKNKDKHRAIPEGYMTVGEIAKRMGITVRTMHHYDKAGLLSPSGESESGYRLYTDKDLVKLNQILSMKHLGFSLDEIKNRLMPLDTPDEVAKLLAEHAAAIRNKLETLAVSLNAVEALRAEVVQMQKVDFKKYAYIIANLQMNNENYWLIKHMDNDTLDYLGSRFTGKKDKAAAKIKEMNRLNKEGARLQAEGVAPDSERGQAFAKEYWNMVLELTGGDTSIIAKLVESADSIERENIGNMRDFAHEALDVYFTNLGYDPYKGANND